MQGYNKDSDFSKSIFHNIAIDPAALSDPDIMQDPNVP